MAKKDSKKKKDKKGSGAADTVDAVRTAVERALPEGSKERGREIVDEVARAVTRVRESLEEHGVLDELGKLRKEIEGLAHRVAALERPGAAKAPTPTAAASRSTAAKPRTTSTRSRTTASRSTASKSTAAKPASSRSTAARKPAAKKPATGTRSTSSRSRSTSSRSRSSGSGSGSSS